MLINARRLDGKQGCSSSALSVLSVCAWKVPCGSLCGCGEVFGMTDVSMVEGERL